MSSLLMRNSSASGSCGCPHSNFRASSGSRSATSFNCAITSYISPLLMLRNESATAWVPSAPPPFPFNPPLPLGSLAAGPLCCPPPGCWLISIPNFPANVSKWLELLKFTRKDLPFKSNPLRFRIAERAACGSSNSTNANPRGFPVSKSFTMRILMSLPSSENVVWSCSSVVLKARFPTKISCFCWLLLELEGFEFGWFGFG
mmetsp:Transcript_54197/g.63317  ORF Transcript_54197/g.63317 Transcript_54197/m.63317 type:complete len:202 (-) Transcript_54197:557-1162(-)